MNQGTNDLMAATITRYRALNQPDSASHITVRDALEEIRSGIHAERIAKLRTLLGDGAAYRKAKEGLPLWSWHGKFTRREDAAIVAHSGLVCLDFDHLPADKLPEIRSRFTTDQHVFAAFTSPGGEGLKVLVPVVPDWKQHRAQFDVLKTYFDALLKPYGSTVKADKIARALSQACFVSHDPEVYTNPSAEVFDVPPPPAPPTGLEDLPPGELAELMREAYRQGDDPSEVVDDTPRPIMDKLLGMVDVVDFQAQANLPADKAPKADHHLLLAIANVLAIAKRADHPLAWVDGDYYVFNGRYWQPLSTPVLRQFLGAAAERMGVNTFRAGVYSFKDRLQRQFDDDAYMEPPPPRLGVVKIPLANGTFVVTPERQELREVFDPADFMTYQLPFAYDPTATSPQFHRFLDRVLPDKDCQAILSEFMGFVFVPHKLLNLHYALLLHGSGANGKSVFADIMTALVGERNVSRAGLSDITKNLNARLSLEHKLANIATEINTELDDTIFKAMCAGEPVPVKKLYHDERTMTTYGKLVFLANTLPRVKDSSDGYFRRLLLVPFTQTLPQGEWDEGLARRIIDNELPGVFNWALEGLRRLWANKRFTKAKAVEDAVAEYREKADPVLGFIRENAVQPDPENAQPLGDWYQRYVGYCKENGHGYPVNRQTFADRLRKNGITVRRGTGGANVVYARCGIVIGTDCPF
jgi:putative DNA primase/helicase